MTKVKRIVKTSKEAEERQIITGLITDDNFIKQIAPLIKLEYFKSPFAKTVATWCLNYWEQYNEAPFDSINSIFESKCRNNQIEEDQQEIISKFLESISDEYEREDKPTQYMASNAETYFKKRSLEILKQDLKASLSVNDIESAESVLASYKSPQRENRVIDINPFTNLEAIQEAWEEAAEPLFTLPGDLGRHLNELLVRGGFLSIMGPEKRGKTWWLTYLARRAAMAGCNVAHFTIGDMTRNQILMRHHIMNCGRSNKPKYCTAGRMIPVLDCLYNQLGTCDRPECKDGTAIAVETTGEGGKKNIITRPFEEAEYHVPCVECQRDRELRHHWKGAVWWKLSEQVEPLDWRDAYKAGLKFDKRGMRGGKLKLSCHPRQSINVAGIRKILKTWEKEEGFIADFVDIDYADNLLPEIGRGEFRHQTNDTWGALRGVSQEWNNLVTTATQADAASYNVPLITEKNFSEDKRKYSHVTGVITLNQLREEKLKGIMRLGKLFVREDDNDTKKVVTVLQNLAAGQPVIGSYY